jgi:hypothetical protein
MRALTFAREFVEWCAAVALGVVAGSLFDLLR